MKRFNVKNSKVNNLLTFDANARRSVHNFYIFMHLNSNKIMIRFLDSLDFPFSKYSRSANYKYHS